MIGVLDTCFLLNRGPINRSLTKAFIPSAVLKELKTTKSKEHYELNKFMIEIRNPSEEYIKLAENINKEQNTNLSIQDIIVVALTIELNEIYSNKWFDSTNISTFEEVVCFTMDNGIKHCLRSINLYEDPSFVTKKYHFRCFSCYAMTFDKIDFCAKCGLNTITRVSVVMDESGKSTVMLKNNYKFRPKVLYNRGIEIKSADQRDYAQYCIKQKYKSKKKDLIDVLGDI